jgi:hypothetical protein
LVPEREGRDFPNQEGTDLKLEQMNSANGFVPTFAWPGYVVRTILFPQLPLVCSKLPLSRPGATSSFLSDERVNAETPRLGLAARGDLLKFRAVVTVLGVLALSLTDLCVDDVVGGELDRISLGLIDRTEVDEGFRRNGVSRPERTESNFDFKVRSVVCVDV